LVLAYFLGHPVEVPSCRSTGVDFHSVVHWLCITVDRAADLRSE